MVVVVILPCSRRPDGWVDNEGVIIIIDIDCLDDKLVGLGMSGGAYLVAPIFLLIDFLRNVLVVFIHIPAPAKLVAVVLRVEVGDSIFADGEPLFLLQDLDNLEETQGPILPHTDRDGLERPHLLLVVVTDLELDVESVYS